jgi:hypothetical protein
MKNLFPSLALFLFFCLSGFAYESPLGMPSEGNNLIVNNRVLARVNDQTITVIDVMEKMRLFLSKNYPTESQSPMTRIKFYMTNWRDVLSQMIDQELIFADAINLELKITDRDIRERLLERFGTNVMTALDKLEISYEKAREMMRHDIAVERMTMYRVHRKALGQIGPHDIKKAYQAYCQSHPSTQEWDYHVISIRAKDAQKAQEIASQAYLLLTQDKQPLDTVRDTLKQQSNEEEEVSITVSEQYTVNEKKISIQHKDVLLQLTPDTCSEPVCQKSRFDKNPVYRIFLLKGHRLNTPPTFTALAEDLKEKLLDQAIAKETQLYVVKLRERFGYDQQAIDSMIPSDFEPFSLK